MQSYYPASFQREMGCTEAEWRRWLPPAVGDCPLTMAGAEGEVSLSPGVLRLRWAVMPPRAIALIRMPRMQVTFEFDGVEEALRQRFMRRFDLYMQRGGG